MSLPEPLTVTVGSAPAPMYRIVGTDPRTTTYRGKFSDGRTVNLDIQQTSNKTRRRHYVKLYSNSIATSTSPSGAMVMTFIFDEAVATSDTPDSYPYWVNAFTALLRDGPTIAKLLNGEA